MACPLIGNGRVAHKYLPYLLTYDTLPTYYRVVLRFKLEGLWDGNHGKTLVTHVMVHPQLKSY
jgi:hypothetical protein